MYLLLLFALQLVCILPLLVACVADAIWLLGLKLLSLNRVWNKWVYMWSGNNGNKNEDVATIDCELFNRPFIVELTFEAVLQLILQSINSSFTGQRSSPSAIISIIFSLVVITLLLHTHLPVNRPERKHRQL